MLKLISSSRRRIAVYTGHLLKKNFASANVNGNPLLKTHKLPPFKLIRVDHIEPAMEVLLSKYEKSIDRLEEQIDNKSIAGWNVFDELELIEQQP